MGRGRFYTKAELDKALELKASGLRWEDVAERLGRSKESLKCTITHYKQGKLFPKRTLERQTRNNRLRELALRGWRPIDMAKDQGISIGLVVMTLNAMGLDAEERALIRADLIRLARRSEARLKQAA